MSYSTIFFDLDDTLYPPTSGIWEAIGSRMEQYMVEKLAIPANSVHVERSRLFHSYGTTLRGLVAEYGIDDVFFLDYVHDIPINEYLSANPRLRETISDFKQRRIIFTNASLDHANRVVKALGIEDLFEQVIDIVAIKPWCKPQAEAFSTALEIAKVYNPAECIMIDDAHRNLVTAHELGFYTIQVGTSITQPPVDISTPSLEHLSQNCPAFLVQEQNV